MAVQSIFEDSSSQDDPSQVHSFYAWKVLTKSDSSEAVADNTQAHIFMLVSTLYKVESFFSELQEHLSIASFGDKMTSIADFNEVSRVVFLDFSVQQASGSSAVR